MVDADWVMKQNLAQQRRAVAALTKRQTQAAAAIEAAAFTNEVNPSYALLHSEPDGDPAHIVDPAVGQRTATLIAEAAGNVELPPTAPPADPPEQPSRIDAAARTTTANDHNRQLVADPVSDSSAVVGRTASRAIRLHSIEVVAGLAEAVLERSHARHERKAAEEILFHLATLRDWVEEPPDAEWTSLTLRHLNEIGVWAQRHPGLAELGKHLIAFAAGWAAGT